MGITARGVNPNIRDAPSIPSFLIQEKKPDTLLHRKTKVVLLLNQEDVKRILRPYGLFLKCESEFTNFAKE